MTFELTDEERTRIVYTIQTDSNFESWWAVIEDIVNQRAARDAEIAAQARLAAAKLSRQKSGYEEGYTPICGSTKHHFGHRIAYTDEWCSGYCDCTHQAKYPHSAGEHK